VLATPDLSNKIVNRIEPSSSSSLPMFASPAIRRKNILSDLSTLPSPLNFSPSPASSPIVVPTPNPTPPKQKRKEKPKGASDETKHENKSHSDSSLPPGHVFLAPLNNEKSETDAMKLHYLTITQEKENTINLLKKKSEVLQEEAQKLQKDYEEIIKQR